MTVRDFWHKTVTETDPLTGKKTKTKVRSNRYGVGKRWRVEYVDIDGKRASKMFEQREAAEIFDAKVKVGKNDGTLIAKSKAEITFNDFWPTWLQTKSNIAPVTIKNYESLWNVHIQPTWGRRRISEVQEHQVATWVANMTTTKGRKPGEAPKPVGDSTKRKASVVLVAMLHYAVKVKIINAAPIDGSISPQQSKPERRALTIDEVDKVLEAAPTKEAKLLLEVLLRTGLRPGEAKGLKVKDLDTTRKRLTVARDVDDLGRIDAVKSRRKREVPISSMMVSILEEQANDKESDDWLLPDEYGHVWTTSRWRVIWDNILTWTGIESTLTTYELRHTAVSMAIAGGADVYVIQRMVGHSSAATTLNHYGHLWDHGLDEAAEAIERHLERERNLLDEARARRAEREREQGVRHLRVVE